MPLTSALAPTTAPTSIARPRRVSVPRPPQPPPRQPFPLLATVAPVLAAAGLYAVTSSPFALVFALLGPVIAAASSLDARLGARRTRRREHARFLADCVRSERLIRSEHLDECDRLARLARPAQLITSTTGLDPEGWRASLEGPVAVRLGVGRVASSLEFSAADELADEFATIRLSELEREASTLVAPVIVDGRLGIGIVGQQELATAAARAIVVQLAAALPPTTTVIEAAAEPVWDWLDALPHHRVAPAEAGGTARARVVFAPVGAGATILVATAATEQLLPHGTRVVVHVGAGAGIVRHPDGAAVGDIQPEFITRAQASRWAAQLSVLARQEGIASPDRQLPATVALTPLLRTGPGGGAGAVTGVTAAGGLRCSVGATATGKLVLDLGADGPHAIVGGTTGSGKSELLISWVLALASANPPDELSFLCVDFKGGASFQPLTGLPHCVGVITDLDEHEALRALTSLRAEIRRRERSLAEALVRSIDDAAPGSLFPRLVLVVDEYAAMVDEFPDLHPLFTDLAARGRSLGIHLILCTQRPSGVVRDGILANCGLRISLRVTSAADSSAVVGTAAAAALPQSARGRAVVSVAGGEPVHAQVARAAATDVEMVTAKWAAAPRPRRPWVAPLPSTVTPADVERQARVDGALPHHTSARTITASTAARGGDLPAGLPFGIADLPHEQRRTVARYDPAVHGNLLVVGGPGAGKTGLLRALETACSGGDTRIPLRLVRASGVAAVWDALVAALDPVAVDERADREPSPGTRTLLPRTLVPRTVLLLDDIDAVVQGCDDEWAIDIADLLGRVLRQGTSGGVHCVVTAQRVPGILQSVLALCGSTLVLRLPSRQEHLLAGADGATYSSDLPPGGGTWQGNRIQAVWSVPNEPISPAVAPAATDVARVGAHSAAPPPLAVVTTDMARMRSTLADVWPGRPIESVGDSGARRVVAPAVADGGTTMPAILLGDVHAWLEQWGAVAALRTTTTILFDGVTFADLRTLTGSRELPPPFPRGSRPMWVLTPDGRMRRASFGGSAGGASTQRNGGIRTNHPI